MKIYSRPPKILHDKNFLVFLGDLNAKIGIEDAKFTYNKVTNRNGTRPRGMWAQGDQHQATEEEEGKSVDFLAPQRCYIATAIPVHRPFKKMEEQCV